MRFTIFLFLYMCLMDFNLIGGITNIENERLILENATVELFGTHHYKRISLVNNSTLYIKFSGRSANGWGSLELIADSIYIDSTSMINGKGRGGVPEISTDTPLYGAGGSYGGIGGKSGDTNHSKTSGEFGDKMNMYNLSQGQAGADGYPEGSYFIGYGGLGGGKLIINCTVFTLNGKIDVSGADGTECAGNGYNVTAGGGGAGGSVGIKADFLYGNGSIFANGGDGGDANGMDSTHSNYGGGGGAGGRVIIAVISNFFNTNNVFVNGGSGGNSTNITPEGSPGENGTFYFTHIPEKPVIISPENNGDSLNPPVFKIKAFDVDSDKLYFKIELSDDDFLTYVTYNQYENQNGWSKQYYTSDEVAEFRLPETLEPGKTYQWRAYVFDGSVFSEPSDIFTFKCGTSVKYNIEEGKNYEEPKILTLNNDGVNDYVKFNVNTDKDVIIKIYNLNGVLIKTLEVNQTIWDGKDNTGNYVDSGVYIIQIQIGNKISTALVNVIK